MPEKKPTRTADLDYFYGQSSELFSFYRIPKLLFQDSRFQPLSTDAKTLYGILLDRMSLSARNGWLDKAGRVFIIYTVQEVQDSLGCADKKATKLLRELEEYGLIERKRRGLGKPDLIYVKNFSSESSKTPYLNRDNDDSGTAPNTIQEPSEVRCNKTERNNTEISDTDPRERRTVRCAVSVDCTSSLGRWLRDHLRAPPSARCTACWAGCPAGHCAQYEG